MLRAPGQPLTLYWGDHTIAISDQQAEKKNALGSFSQSQGEHRSTKENATVTQSIDGPISFPLVNPTRVITPHYDALVLTVCINGFDVHRVLVDPGSATNLLHLPAFKQMRVPIDHLSSAGRVLSGFNGATILTVGDIAFPVWAGPVTQQILFSVVEDLGPYNAILGRTWLHAMKAIPSTYHQTIIHLTAFGQVDLQGSQLAARQCYQLSLQGREQSECSSEPPLEDQPSQ